MTRTSFGTRRGLTLTDLVVALATAVLLSGSVLTAGIFQSREQANRIKCASNLKQIGLAALMYVNEDVRSGAYPRTFFNSTNPKLIVDTTGYGKKESFDAKVTGDNNLPASFYLLLRTQDITPSVFVCPSSKGVPGFGKGAKVGVQDSSNWEAIPDHLTYSYNCPFPTQKAIAQGWKFNGTLGSDFPLGADMNPGTPELLKVTSNATKEQMKAVNSRNHGGEGQNVVYCDGHVEFQLTPFCGAPGAGDIKSHDNVYTYGGPNDNNGGEGIVGQPVSAFDSVLLPADDASKPAAGKPAAQPATPKGS